MKGFLLGLIVASAGWGGFVYWQRPSVPVAPESTAGPSTDPTVAANDTRPKRRRGARRTQAGGAASEGAIQTGDEAAGDELAEAPQPMKLTGADLRQQARGDDLSRPDVVRMDLTNAGPARELDQDEIDARFRGVEDEILDCIQRARPDAVTYVPGRVSVAFRITREGSVRGVRVEAPAILQRGDLFGCVSGVVRRLRFPASDGSQIVTYPFSLG